MSRGDFGFSQQGSSSYGSVTYQRSNTSRDRDDFNNICDTISGKIFIINKNVSRLESLSKNSEFINQENETKIHALSQETNKLANETKGCFQNISEYTRTGRFEHLDHRQQQYNLLQDKLLREFENSLSRYHAIQNVLSLKMKEVIEKEVRISQDTSALIDISTNENEDDVNLIEENNRTQQVLAHEDELEQIKERNERIQQIEEDMLNVNDIFRDLATMIHDQGAQIDSIESHVEIASIQVSEGNKHLQRAKTYQKSARKRLCCILLASVLAAVILGVVIYYSVK